MFAIQAYCAKLKIKAFEREGIPKFILRGK